MNFDPTSSAAPRMTLHPTAAPGRPTPSIQFGAGPSIAPTWHDHALQVLPSSHVVSTTGGTGLNELSVVRSASSTLGKRSRGSETPQLRREDVVEVATDQVGQEVNRVQEEVKATMLSKGSQPPAWLKLLPEANLQHMAADGAATSETKVWAFKQLIEREDPSSEQLEARAHAPAGSVPIEHRAAALMELKERSQFLEHIEGMPKLALETAVYAVEQQDHLRQVKNHWTGLRGNPALLAEALSNAALPALQILVRHRGLSPSLVPAIRAELQNREHGAWQLVSAEPAALQQMAVTQRDPASELAALEIQRRQHQGADYLAGLDRGSLQAVLGESILPAELQGLSRPQLVEAVRAERQRRDQVDELTRLARR